MAINEHHRWGTPNAGGGSRSLELPLGDPVGAEPCVGACLAHPPGSLGQDLTVSLSWQQGHPCGEEEEREAEK